MGRKLDVDMLVGSEEITKRLQLKDRQRLHDFRRRYLDFPPPVVKLEQALIWYWPEVEEWARNRGRLPTDHEARDGRPSRSKPRRS